MDTGSTGSSSGAVTLQGFLNRHKTNKGEAFNFTSLARPPGAYFVPPDQLPQFYKLYLGHVKSGAMPHLTEKPGPNSPVLVDFDFRFPLEVKERQYTREFVRAVVREYFDFFQRYIVIDDSNARCYVFEREGPYQTAKETKDGIHMVFPHITCSAPLKLLAREHVMVACAPLFHELGATNPVADIVDRAVIDRNNWFMVGSGKVGCQPYDLTMVLNEQPEEVSVDRDLDTIVPLLSVRGTTLPNVRYAEGVDEDDIIAEWAAAEAASAAQARAARTRTPKPPLPPPPPAARPKSTKLETCDDCELVKKLVAILSPARADDYSTWLQVGFCLHNIDLSLLEDWEAFSQKSGKYEAGVCERRWEAMSPGTLGVGSLVRWAKMDAPEEYERIRREDVRSVLQESVNTGGAHYSVAKVLYALYRYNYVCLSRKFKTWIEFRGHRWHRSDDGYGLLTKLSNELYKQYSMLANEYSRKVADIEDQDEKERLEKKKAQCNRIATELLNTNFKSNIMKEAYELFYVEGFEEKLDTYRNLIGFNNGVYDLDALEFRDGRPEDCITLSTNTEYQPYEACSSEVEQIEHLLAQIFVDDEIRVYICKLLASFLSGDNKLQKFHLWTGSGGNGKSVLVNLFSEALGQYTTVLPISLLTSKRNASNSASPELARTKGRRFCVLQEPEDDVRINVGLMKELTGGDKIVTRELFCPIIEFKPQFKMVLTCNRLPEIASNDGGTWRRIRVVEFASKFCEHPDPENPLEFQADMTLESRLPVLAPAFASFLIHWYKIYADEGIQEPASVLAYTLEYQQKCDVYLEFVNSTIVATDDQSDLLRCSEVYAAFKEHYKLNESDLSRLPNAKDMRLYLDTKLHKSSNSIWRGFRIRTLNEDVFE